MKIGFYNVYKEYNNNKMFITSKSSIGDDLAYFSVFIYESLTKLGHEVSTIDIGDINRFDMVFFFDLPSDKEALFKQLLKNKKAVLYLLIFESELIRPSNWNKSLHYPFEKIFTWHDEWVDNKRYYKYFWPNKIPKNIHFDISQKRKLCTIISGNKVIYNDTRELYSKRVEAIKWFEKFAPKDFDLYGTDWKSGVLKKPFVILLKNNFLLKVYYKLRRYSFFQRIMKPFSYYFKSYKGRVDSKSETLSNYKFTICYENAKDIPGYITEKIFDCFFSGSIPIYLGAPNITDFVPKDTFIDARKFASIDEIYHKIKSMPDDEYLKYISEIESFITSQEIQIFNAKNISKMVENEINYLS